MCTRATFSFFIDITIVIWEHEEGVALNRETIKTDPRWWKGTETSQSNLFITFGCLLLRVITCKYETACKCRKVFCDDDVGGCEQNQKQSCFRSPPLLIIPHSPFSPSMWLRACSLIGGEVWDPVAGRPAQEYRKPALICREWGRTTRQTSPRALQDYSYANKVYVCSVINQKRHEKSILRRSEAGWERKVERMFGVYTVSLLLCVFSPRWWHAAPLMCILQSTAESNVMMWTTKQCKLTVFTIASVLWHFPPFYRNNNTQKLLITWTATSLVLN